jgi:formate-dependent phosphoribosylglycinamide formyltransferase (GAR transformylase)
MGWAARRNPLSREARIVAQRVADRLLGRDEFGVEFWLDDEWSWAKQPPSKGVLTLESLTDAYEKLIAADTRPRWTTK